MNQALKLERPKPLTDLAVASIRTSIVEGRQLLGQQLSEAALALSLGISAYQQAGRASVQALSSPGVQSHVAASSR